MISLLRKTIDWLCGKGTGISLIVPIHIYQEGSHRQNNWRWLEKYWKAHLPAAQIILGLDALSEADPTIPFSKSCAVNDAAKRATGDIFVIVDADGYISADVVLQCAQKIRRDRERGHRLWFVPYRQFHRLTRHASKRLLASNPCDPYRFPKPPRRCDIQNDSGSRYGHWWGAGIQILPREAFEEVGGWDERFRGWGGEDHAALMATDTLYWKHKTHPGQHLHVWHPMISPKGQDLSDSTGWVSWQYRVWENQESSGANDKLAGRYYGANGDYERMRKLVDEGRYFLDV